MSSRRKQTKPKSCIINGIEIFDTSANDNSISVNENFPFNNSLKRKREDEETDYQQDDTNNTNLKNAENDKNALDENKITTEICVDKERNNQIEEEKVINDDNPNEDDIEECDDEEDEDGDEDEDEDDNGIDMVDQTDDLSMANALNNIFDEDNLNNTHGNFNGSLAIRINQGNDNRNNAMTESFSLIAYRCKICGKGFKHSRSLNRHVKLHTGEKNYKCDICGSAFARSDHLKAHFRTHNNQKPFQCSVCHCGYGTQSALKIHMAHNHSKSKFRCNICNDLEFHSQLALEGHIYNEHSSSSNKVDFNDQALINNRSDSNSDNKLADISNNINNTALSTNENEIQQEIQDDKLDQNSEDNDIIMEEPTHLRRNSSINSNNNVINKYVNSFSSQQPVGIVNKNPIHPPNITQTRGPIPQLASAPIHHNINNTYCEMCNARFSNVESYQAHMKNSHRNYSLEKMPYLSNALINKQPPPLVTGPSSNNIKPVDPSIIAKNTNLMPPPLQQPPIINKCSVPSCNCTNSVNYSKSVNLQKNNENIPNNLNNTLQQDFDKNEDYFLIKETHYTCVQCHLTFFKLNDYMIHLKQEHCLEVYRCILCKQMQLFDNLNLLKEHFFQVHQSHKYDLYRCRLCLNKNSSSNESSIFHSINDLYMHIQNYHNQDSRNVRVIVSGPPNLGHSQPTHPQAYQISHPPPPPPPPPPLQHHLNGGPFHSQHHGPYRPPPPHMMSTYNHPSQRNDRFHYLNSSNKCFKCQYCDSDFAQQNSLNQHIHMVHNIKLPSVQFQPPLLAPNIVSSHIHTTSQPFSLSSQHPSNIMNNETNNCNDINKNNNTNGIVSQSYPCQFCRNSFSNRAQLDRHLRIHVSSIDLKCNICDRQFETQDLLEQHKTTHGKTFNMNIDEPLNSDKSKQIPQNLQSVINNSINNNTNIKDNINEITNNNATTGTNSSTATSTTTATNSANAISAITTTNTTFTTSAPATTTASVNNSSNTNNSENNNDNNNITNKINNNNNSPTTGNSANLNINSSISRIHSTVCAYCKQTIENEIQFKEHFKRHNNIQNNNKQQTNNVRPISFVCIVCRQSLSSNNEYNMHMKHHLRRLPPNNTTNKANNNSNNNDNNINNSNNNNSSSLKCSKCLIKFEKWDELVEHMSKSHSINLNNDNNNSLKTFNSVNSPLSTDSSSISSTSAVSRSSNTETNNNNSNNFSKSNSDMNKQPSMFVVKEERTSPLNTTTNGNQANDLSKTKALVATENLCEICTCKFDNQLKLQCHLLVKHEFSQTNGALLCPVCDESFSRPEILLSHTQIHGPSAKIYKCTQCVLSFVFKSQLINHSFCHQSTVNKNNVSSQSYLFLKNSNNDANRISNIDNQRRSLNQPSNNVLNRPLINNNLNLNSTTNINNIDERTSTQYKNDLNENNTNFKTCIEISETGNKFYKCLTCNKKFQSERNLSFHLRIHTGFRPFECDVCKRRFTRRENLRSHMNCHLSIRPFSCPICNRTFKRRAHVTSHIETHLKPQIHNCVECSISFDVLDLFLKHLIREHYVNDSELITLIQNRNLIDPIELKTLLANINVNKQFLIQNKSMQSGKDDNNIYPDEIYDDLEIDEDLGEPNQNYVEDNNYDDEQSSSLNDDINNDDINDQNEENLNKINEELEQELADEMSELVNENYDDILNNDEFDDKASNKNDHFNNLKNHNNEYSNEINFNGVHIVNGDDDFEDDDVY